MEENKIFAIIVISMMWIILTFLLRLYIPFAWWIVLLPVVASLIFLAGLVLIVVIFVVVGAILITLGYEEDLEG